MTKNPAADGERAAARENLDTEIIFKKIEARRYHFEFGGVTGEVSALGSVSGDWWHAIAYLPRVCTTDQPTRREAVEHVVELVRRDEIKPIEHTESAYALLHSTVELTLERIGTELDHAAEAYVAADKTEQQRFHRELSAVLGALTTLEDRIKS